MAKVSHVQVNSPAAPAPNRKARRQAKAGTKKKSAGASQTQVIGDLVIATDSLGRKLHMRKLKPSERYQLDNTVEAQTMSAAMTQRIAASVIMIDQDALPPITTTAELYARLDLLGDEGMMAITEPGMKMYGIDLDSIEKHLAKN